MNTQLYTYKAYVSGVYDGDSITADIDLGFRHIMRSQKLRLYGIDTPELRGDEREAGLRARDYLREMILEKDVLIVTHKDRSGKYGRWLATVWLPSEDSEVYENVNHILVAEGYAETYILR